MIVLKKLQITVINVLRAIMLQQISIVRSATIAAPLVLVNTRISA